MDESERVWVTRDGFHYRTMHDRKPEGRSSVEYVRADLVAAMHAQRFDHGAVIRDAHKLLPSGISGPHTMAVTAAIVEAILRALEKAAL